MVLAAPVDRPRTSPGCACPEPLALERAPFRRFRVAEPPPPVDTPGPLVPTALLPPPPRAERGTLACADLALALAFARAARWAASRGAPRRDVAALPGTARPPEGPWAGPWFAATGPA